MKRKEKEIRDKGRKTTKKEKMERKPKTKKNG